MWKFSKIFGLIIGVFLIGLAGLLIPKPALYPEVGHSKALFDKDQKLLALSISSDEKYRLIVPLQEISTAMIQATLIYEDRYFLYHPGVNPLALVRASITSLLNPKRLVGGSTITMQLARLRFNLQTRSFSGKLKQICYALFIEAHYSKAAILEAYLNLAPYGANIEGVGAASLVYYRKPAKDIAQDEALTLAVLPQHPAVRWKPDGQVDLDQARNILRTSWQATATEKLPLPRDFVYSPREIPFEAPHFFNRVSSSSSANVFVSTLDRELQNEIERELSGILKRFGDYGIVNGTVILAELPDLKVRAYLGSANYLNSSIDGFVNGLAAKRSPGSLLKPFVYGLALDQGLILPETTLIDLPIRLAAYTPQNYERNFLGPLSATDALVRSRNIPALELFRKLEAKSFYKLLTSSGVAGLKDEDYYGIALVLGGLEVTAEEVVSLYSSLANSGRSRPLIFLENNPKPKAQPVKLFSAEAAFLVREMLSKNPPALGRFKNLNIPWKTGTSYSSKDAWAAGLVGKYVLLVWLGNFDGSPNPNLIGRDMAGPVFFSIVDRLVNRGVDPQITEQGLLNLKKIEVCSVSGALPGPDCPHKKQSWFISGVSPVKTCALHQAIHINPESGLRMCRGEQGGIRKVYEVWDSGVQSIFTRAGLKRRAPPAYEAQCSIGNQSTGSIRIISPEEHVQYYYQYGKQLELEFSASTSGDVRQLNWFVDNELVARVNPNETYHWKARIGDFNIRAVDDLGRSKVVKIKILLVGS